MILVIVRRGENGKRSGRARKWASRWLPEIASGVFAGEIAGQGLRRFISGFSNSPNVEVRISGGSTKIWLSGIPDIENPKM